MRPNDSQSDLGTNDRRDGSSPPGYERLGERGPFGRASGDDRVLRTLRWPRNEIFLVDALGRHPRRVTHFRETLAEPVWSPDGRRVAFEAAATSSGRVRGLRVMNRNGSGVRRITRGESPSWSPDAKRIAFSHWIGGIPRIFIANADGSRVRQLVADAQGPAWSPDGASIVFLRGLARSDIVVARVKDGKITRLTRTPERKAAPLGRPTGEAFCMAPRGEMETSPSTSWTPTRPTAGGFSTASTSGSRRGRLMGRGSSSGLHRSLCLALHRLPLRLASPVVRVFDLQPAAIVLAIEARVFLARTGRLRRPLALHVVEHFEGTRQKCSSRFRPHPA